MLLCIFDSVDKNGLTASYDRLSTTFPTRLMTYDSEDSNIDILVSSKEQMIDTISKLPVTVVLTNYLAIVPALSKINKNKLIVWLTDRSGGPVGKRQDQINFWRQTMGVLKSVDQIYVSSHYMAKAFMQNYRVPCKVQYPFIPDNPLSSGEMIYYNQPPVYLERMQEFAPNEIFVKIEDYNDFRNGKLYLHTACSHEFSHLEIPIAASYGVPSVIENYGCVTEYISGGDKVLPTGADEKTWVQAFKAALRDRNINSQTVKKLSLRYNQMSELEDRIKQVLKNKLGKQMHPPTFHQIQAAGKPPARPPREVKEPIVKKQPIRQQSFFGISPSHISSIKECLAENQNVYFSCGGLGDAMLILAACQNDKDAKVIFGANHASVEKLFEAFKVPVLTTPNFFPSAFGLSIHKLIVNHPNFKGSAHIPDTMNYGEWIINPGKYLDRTVKEMPLIEKFGKLVNPRATEGVVGIAPRGSDHVGRNKQRFLSIPEFRKLCEHHLSKNRTVFAFGSTDDIEHYGILKDNNFIWMSSDYGVSHPAPRYPTSMRHLLSAINACDEVVSVDTWLKTYSALAGIPTKVVKSRREGRWQDPPHDSSDHIFMNKDFWGFEVVEFDQLFK